VSQRKVNRGKDCGKNRQMSITEKYVYMYRREPILCPCNLQKLLLLLLLLCLSPQAFSPGTSPKPMVMPTAQASSFRLQYFPCPVCCSKYIIIIIIIITINVVSCHRPFLPGTSLEPAVIPTAQASNFTLQYFPYYV
jgi:hypothetical protein